MRLTSSFRRVANFPEDQDLGFAPQVWQKSIDRIKIPADERKARLLKDVQSSLNTGGPKQAKRLLQRLLRNLNDALEVNNYNPEEVMAERKMIREVARECGIP